MTLNETFPSLPSTVNQAGAVLSCAPPAPAQLELAPQPVKPSVSSAQPPTLEESRLLIVNKGLRRTIDELQIRIQQLEANLHQREAQYRADLDQLNSKLQSTEEDLQHTVAHLQQTRLECDRTTAEKETLFAQVRAVSHERDIARSEAQAADTRAEQATAQLHEHQKTFGRTTFDQLQDELSRIKREHAREVVDLQIQIRNLTEAQYTHHQSKHATEQASHVYAELESIIHEKDEIISQLHSEIAHMSASRQPPTEPTQQQDLRVQVH